MAVNRYKGSINVISGKHTDFPIWLFLSVAIHLIPAIVIALIPRVPHREFRPPVYQVELMTRPEAVKAEEAPKNEEPIPREEPKVEPKVKVKLKDIKPKSIKNAKKEVVIPKPKHKEDAAMFDDAMKKIKDKVTAEEAVEEKIKKYKEKETASGGGIKIAAKAPAKVYRKEELEAEMSLYYDIVIGLITEKWSVPPFLSNKGYVAKLSIHIRKDGTIESMWMETASGNRPYDETAFKAINKVGVLPPLPKGWKSDSIDMGLEF
ncbi:MAG: hypothetical protein HW415_723 [Deltaproteobacteria bacterium]|nr:hypothetical protein [Deltaproteobacteria bacterium]